jgi:hypothetical protein
MVVGRGESEALVAPGEAVDEVTASGTAIDDWDIRCTRVGDDARKDNWPVKQTQVLEVRCANDPGAVVLSRSM